MGVPGAVAIVLGIVCVIIGWVRKGQKWGGMVFWLGVILLLVPIAWEFFEVIRQGLNSGASA
jgi:4-amino-4-deoxy-L-arabinose transferase-like glycosyltransferase